MKSELYLVVYAKSPEGASVPLLNHIHHITVFDKGSKWAKFTGVPVAYYEGELIPLTQEKHSVFFMPARLINRDDEWMYYQSPCILGELKLQTTEGMYERGPMFPIRSTGHEFRLFNTAGLLELLGWTVTRITQVQIGDSEPIELARSTN